MVVPIFFQKGIDGDAGWRAACEMNHRHLSYRLRPKAHKASLNYGCKNGGISSYVRLQWTVWLSTPCLNSPRFHEMISISPFFRHIYWCPPE